MSAPLEHQHNRATVTPAKPAKVIQTVQGLYYIVGGLLVACFIWSIQGPADSPQPERNLWPTRVVALVVAGFGVALVLSGRRGRHGFIPASVCMLVSLVLLAQSAAGMALGFLPLTFLIDATFEATFLAWWLVTMLGRIEREIDRAPVFPA